MLRFQYENYFLLMILVPLMIVVYQVYKTNRLKGFRKYFSLDNLKSLLTSPPGSILEKTPWLLVIGIALLVFGMANLQKGKYISGKSDTAGRDVMFVLDVSKSMNAQDVKPSRMDASKLLVNKLIKRASHDRLGLTVFAGNSTVLTPLSSDYLTLQEELQKVRPGMEAVQGTNIASALEMTQRSFKNNPNQNKAIVLITDGEDHEKGVQKQVNELKSEGVQIFTIGVGSKKGSSFVDVQTGKNQVDREGKEVVSKMNPEVIEEIAKQAGGDFTILRSVNQASSDLVDDLSKLGSNTYSESNFQQSRSYYLIFIFLGFLCLLLETLLSHGLIRYHKVVAAVVLTFVSQGVQAQTEKKMDRKVQKKIYKGNKEVEGKNFETADKLYSEVLEKQPDNPIANYNLATSKYLQKSAPDARANYTKSLQNTQDPAKKSKVHYNIGNTYMLEKNWDGAIEAYKQSLMLNPQDENARYNLAYAQKMKSNDKDKKNDPKDDKQDQNQKPQDNKDKKDKDMQKQDQSKPKPQPQSKMSKQEAERALQNLRKKSEDFKKGDTIEGRPIQQNEKDW